MVQDFIISYAKLIVKYPQKLRIESFNIEEGYDEITLYTDPQDVGKLIGKEGKMISAIKTVISGCKARGAVNYRINIKPTE